VHRLAPLSARFVGSPVAGENPGWRGHVSVDAPFVVLALVQTGTKVLWGKAEVTAGPTSDVTLHLHPLNHEGTSVQFLFTFGSGMVTEATASFQPGRLSPVQLPEVPLGPGRAFRLCTFASQPPCAFFIFFLAASDVTAGRTGVWRPHKILRGAFPEALETALFGARHGSFSGSVAAF